MQASPSEATSFYFINHLLRPFEDALKVTYEREVDVNGRGKMGVKFEGSSQ